MGMRVVRERMGTGVLMAYALPALPLAALTLPVYILLPAHYAGLGLSLALIGQLLLLARLWDGVTDPLVGWLSDRTHAFTGGRFGRRKPWVLAGLPLTMAGLWFLLVPPVQPGALYLVGWSMLLYLGWTMMIVPFTAWGAEMSGDYDERTRISAWREGFVVIGTVAALVLPVAAGVGSAGQEGEALKLLAVVLLVVLPLATALLLWIVPEPKTNPAPATGWAQGMRFLASNGPFRTLIAAYVLNGIANGLPAQLFLFFVQYKLMEGERAGLLLIAYFAAGLAAVPLWLKLSTRYGKHRVWSWAMLWACLWFVTVPLLGPGDFLGFLVICILTGAALGADLVLPGAMQADVVDADTAASGGEPRTGLYFALWSLATKLAVAVAALGLTAAAWFGFTVTGENTPGALMALTALYCLMPIVFKLAAIALLWRWPLTRTVQQDLRRRIDAGLAGPTPPKEAA
ncbi:MAG: hypothetical protein RLY86_578 [Pseudomonadota bacterium]|jgi:Na+/melibiose symporter-like transporter